MSDEVVLSVEEEVAELHLLLDHLIASGRGDDEQADAVRERIGDLNEQIRLREKGRS